MMVSNNPFRQEYESVTLDLWIRMHPSEEEIREVFLNMDIALKYIHDHGYCIYVFHPSEIEVLENSVDHINFRKLMELPKDAIKAKAIKKDDIFNSSLIQLSFYCGVNSEKMIYFTPEFVREHFEELIQFLPNGDVPYYRGVVQRGASVYFCEYALEKRNRDLIELEKQFGDDESIVKPINNISDSNNNKINDTIYRRINGLRDSAFVNVLIVPTIALTIMLLFAVVAWIISSL